MWLATETTEVVQATLLPLAPVQPLTAGMIAGRLHHLVLDPVYQLK